MGRFAWFASFCFAALLFACSPQLAFAQDDAISSGALPVEMNSADSETPITTPSNQGLPSDVNATPNGSSLEDVIVENTDTVEGQGGIDEQGASEYSDSGSTMASGTGVKELENVDVTLGSGESVQGEVEATEGAEGANGSDAAKKGVTDVENGTGNSVSSTVDNEADPVELLDDSKEAGELVDQSESRSLTKSLTANSDSVQLANTESADPAGKAANVAKASTTTAKTTTMAKSSSTAKAIPKASISYIAHVQNRGWMSWVKDGALAGTSGKSLRLEALQIKIVGASGGVQCMAHVQNIGWQGVVSQGGTVGSEGKSLRVEALRIKLTGDVSKYYDVRYRAHVQNVGWQDWVSNGAISGTTGRALRIEAIEVELTEKQRAANEPSDGIVGVRYRDHVQNVGWQSYVFDGATAGTTGKALRVEAFNIYLDKGIYSGGIEYRAHVQNVGWQGWKSNGAVAGTTGRLLRVEAFQIRLTGQISKEYDVLYRAHVENVGWQPWAVDGGTSGTSGKSLRVEAMQIKLVKKGSAQTIPEGTYIIASALDCTYTIDDPNSSQKAGTQLKVATFNDDLDQHYYIAKAGNGVYSLQSITSALYLGDSNGKLVQTGTTVGDAQKWKVSWDGGYQFVNASTGRVVTISGGKAVNNANLVTQASSGDKSKRWTLTVTSMIPDGVYVLANTSSGEVVGVAGGKRTNTANVESQSANGSNSQKFRITHLGGEVYSIRNVATGRCVEVYGEYKNQGANISMFTWHEGPGQKWKAHLTGPSSFQFTNVNSGMALSRESSSAHVNICQKSASNTAQTQQFKLIPTSRVKEVVNIGVPVVMQNPELPTGCESVALTEALKYYGYNLKKTTIADKYMPWSATDFVYSFMGNPHTSYGAMICAPGITNTANAYLRDKGSSLRATNRTGSSLDTLLTYTDRGVPVVVWSTMYFGNRGAAQASSHGYTMYSNTHAVTISGYDPFKKKILVADPLSGSVWRDESRFRSLYNQMGRQAVTIE